MPDSTEGTNLDALWITDDGVTTLCEVKLSEAEFGTAKDDLEHNDKLASIYLPILTGHVDSTLLKAPEFFEAYQILRNVWHLCNLHKKQETGRLIFLLPKANTFLDKELARVLAMVTNPVIRASIFVFYIENVLESLIKDPSCPLDLRMHTKEMKVKYVI